MTMTLILVIILLGLAGAGMYEIRDAGVKSCELAQAQKDEKIHALEADLQERTQQWAAEAQRKIEADVALDEQRKAKGTTIAANIQREGAKHVAQNPVYRNSECALPDASVQLINRTTAAMRSAADPTAILDAVPAPGAAAGRAAGDGLPVDAAPISAGRPGSGVLQEGRQIDRGGAVSRGDAHEMPRPKPRPINKR